MNERIRELATQATKVTEPDDPDYRYEFFDKEKFAKSIVYDFLSELTNDDALGEARINTIQRLAEKWGVAR